VDGALEGRDFSVSIDAQLELHVLFVTAAAVVKHLFARIDHLHGPTGLPAQQCGAKIERGGLGLSAESAADGRADDPNPPERDVQDVGHHVLDVVWNLRRGVEYKCSVVLPCGDRGVRFQRRLVDMIAGEGFLTDMVRFGEGLFDIAEALLYVRIDVLFVAIVDLGRPLRRRLEWIEDGGQFLVFDFDQGDCTFSSALVNRGDNGHLVADVANLVSGQDIFVVSCWRNTIHRVGHVFSGENGYDAREGLGPGGVDPFDKTVCDG